MMTDKLSPLSLGDLFKFGPLTSGSLWVGLLILLGSAASGGLGLSNRGLWTGVCLFLVGAACYHGQRVLVSVQDYDRDPNGMAWRSLVEWRPLVSLLVTLALLGLSGSILVTKRAPTWLAQWWVN